MNYIVHQVCVAQWIQNIEECNHRSEEMTAKQQLENNNISENILLATQSQGRSLNKNMANVTVPSISANNGITFAEILNMYGDKQAGSRQTDILSDSLLPMSLLNVRMQLQICPIQYKIQCFQKY